MEKRSRFLGNILKSLLETEGPILEKTESGRRVSQETKMILKDLATQLYGDSNPDLFSKYFGILPPGNIGGINTEDLPPQRILAKNIQTFAYARSEPPQNQTPGKFLPKTEAARGEIGEAPENNGCAKPQISD
ncbi:MAG: hypothetical protein ACP5E4_04285, partial [Candidatus Aenigmatarchaeota archaeon]